MRWPPSPCDAFPKTKPSGSKLAQDANQFDLPNGIWNKDESVLCAVWIARYLRREYGVDEEAWLCKKSRDGI